MRIICKLPNASEEINGVPFTQVEGGMASEDLDAETAANFLTIPGYEEFVEADDGKKKKAAPTTKPQDPPAA